MHLDEIELKAKDGRIFTLRSLAGTDAKSAIAFMARIFAESPYLSRYADEWSMSEEEEHHYLDHAHQAERRLMIGAFVEGELIAIADYVPMGSVSKMAHRSRCAIAVDQAFHGIGIGTAMMKVLIKEAKRVGYEQMELEVVSENKAAIGLYEKLGFVRHGLLPRGFKNRDGSYCELISMLLTL